MRNGRYERNKDSIGEQEHHLEAFGRGDTCDCDLRIYAQMDYDRIDYIHSSCGVSLSVLLPRAAMAESQENPKSDDSINPQNVYI